MFGHTFYHDTIRKYVILFGTLFNETYIRRVDNSGDEQQILKIPIMYAPRDKILARLDSNPDLNNQAAVTLPRMSFEMSSITYDPDRKLNTINRNVVADADDNSKLKTVYNPVPYLMNFSLYIYVKNADDGTKILEQILPFFRPEWTASVNLLPELSLSYDIPTILNSVSSEDIYEGDFITRRAMIWTLEFTMKGYVFGPTTSKSIITLANTNFFIDETAATTGTSNTNVENVTVLPGLSNTGTATSNSSLSVDRSEIAANDDFGYISTITSVDD